MAARIQRRLLPQGDPRCRLRGVRAERALFEIGGDYYDFIWRGERRLLLVVADVSGKGVGAALLMAAFQASLRTLAPSELELAEHDGAPESGDVRQLAAGEVRHRVSRPSSISSATYCDTSTPVTIRRWRCWVGRCARSVPGGPVIGLLPKAKLSRRRDRDSAGRSAGAVHRRHQRARGAGATPSTARSGWGDSSSTGGADPGRLMRICRAAWSSRRGILAAALTAPGVPGCRVTTLSSPDA